MSICVLVVLFVVDRVGVLVSSGHLFTDVNPAEYGFLSVLADFGGRPIEEQLADPRARAELLHSFRVVGNQMHGTLAALGVVMLAVAEQTQAVLGTGLLRAFGLGQATLTVTLWLVGLWRATRSLGTLFGFALLAVFGPPVWLGLNLLCWGTHETVGLVQAALVCLALPWMAHPASEVQQAIRTIGLGALAGLSTLLNPSLALPAVSVTLAVAMAAWVRVPSVGRLGWALASVVGAFVVGIGTLNGVLATGVLDGLGFPRGLPLERLTGFVGKNGGPFLHFRLEASDDLARWLAMARAQAFVQEPTAAYGVHAVAAEIAARIGILGTGIMAVSLAVGRSRVRRSAHRRAAAWVGLHLVGGMVATLWLTRYTTLEPTVFTGTPPRYFAHLYPFGFAVVAMVGTQSRAPLRRAVAWVVAAWVVWVGLFEHLRCLDSDRLDVEEARIALRYDGAAAWFTDRPRASVPAHRRPLSAESDDYRRGYAAITGLQTARYWSWTRPVELKRAPGDVAVAFGGALRSTNGVADLDAYWRGVGAALRVAIPRRRMPHAANFWREQGRWSDSIRSGYEDPY